MTRSIKTIVPLFLLVLLLTQVSDLYSKRAINYKFITIKKISRYNEDRIAFQHVEINTDPYKIDKTDNSLSCLLIVKDKKMYLFKDGYDDPKNVASKRLILEMSQRLIPDLWIKKVDSIPDYLIITDRRNQLMRNNSQEFIQKNFGTFYSKIKDTFLKKHVTIFRNLIINKKDSPVYINRYALPLKRRDKGKARYYVSVTAKTIDEKVYFAEDADGDGITETFTVNLPDGFNWGYKSGPNIVFIKNNKQENLKKIIGKITNEALYGTKEEENLIIKTFPKDQDIINMIDDIYRVVTPDILKKK